MISPGVGKASVPKGILCCINSSSKMRTAGRRAPLPRLCPLRVLREVPVLTLWCVYLWGRQWARTPAGMPCRCTHQRHTRSPCRVCRSSSSSLLLFGSPTANIAILIIFFSHIDKNTAIFYSNVLLYKAERGCHINYFKCFRLGSMNMDILIS